MGVRPTSIADLTHAPKKGGQPVDVESAVAIAEALKECEQRLEGLTPVAGMLMASVEYQHDSLLAGIHERWPELALIGGTTDGEVSCKGGFQSDSVLLVLFAGRGLEAVATVGRDLSGDVQAAVGAALEGLPDRKPALILTSFAPSTNASLVLREIDEQIGDRKAPVVGGLTGDHREFEQIREFAGREVLADSLPILALYGDFKASWGVSSGWMPMGADHRVTRSVGNVVYEIDGRAAAEIYAEYYIEYTSTGLAEFPLALYADQTGDDFVMRALLGADQDTGTLVFAGEMPEGARVRMTNVLSEGILDGTRRSLEQALGGYPGNDPRFAMLFSCAARQWVLGGQAQAELEVVRAALPTSGPSTIAVAGFYCFGEILPGDGAGPSLLHNDSCVSLILGE